jgi:hypothetical protein
MEPNEDRPAFPCVVGAFCKGLSKREIFAAIAMHAMLSGRDVMWPRWAQEPAEIADAVLAALERSKVGEVPA